MIVLSDNATDLLGNRHALLTSRPSSGRSELAKTSVDMGTRDLILQCLGLRGENDQSLTTRTLGTVSADLRERDRSPQPETLPRRVPELHHTE